MNRVSGANPHRHLSERQLACLRLVAEGLTSKEIGRRFGLSPSTVDSHVRTAIERLGVRDRNAAAALIMQGNPPLGDDQQGQGPPLDAPDAFRFLPPLGGRPNRLNAAQRISYIVQIALVGIAAMAAATVTIAGLVHLFSP